MKVTWGDGNKFKKFQLIECRTPCPEVAKTAI